jgi:hypothetical protein
VAGQPIVRVEGARELRKALKSVEGGLADLKATHNKIAQVVVPAGKSGVPRRTGRLADSIRGTGTKTASIVRAGGARVPYANPIHWGWPARNIKGQPFLSDAGKETEPVWTEIYAHDTQALIDRAITANAMTHE